MNIYSYRQPVLIEPMLQEFTKQTGIKTNVIYARKGLAERIKAEGANSPADLIFTVDLGRLTGAAKAGVTHRRREAGQSARTTNCQGCCILDGSGALGVNLRGLRICHRAL